MLSRNTRLVSSLGITGLCHKAGILLLNAWHVLLFFQLANTASTRLRISWGWVEESGELILKVFLETQNKKQNSICLVLHFQPFCSPPKCMYWYIGSVYAVGLMTWKLSALISTCRAVLGNRVCLMPRNPHCLALLYCKERCRDFFKPSMKLIW